MKSDETNVSDLRRARNHWAGQNFRIQYGWSTKGQCWKSPTSRIVRCKSLSERSPEKKCEAYRKTNERCLSPLRIVIPLSYIRFEFVLQGNEVLLK